MGSLACGSARRDQRVACLFGNSTVPIQGERAVRALERLTVWALGDPRQRWVDSRRLRHAGSWRGICVGRVIGWTLTGFWT